MDRISGAIPALTGAAQARPVRPAATAGRSAKTERRFDSVRISGSAQNAFEMRLRSKVTQEVRATGTMGNLSALRSQVQGGTYQTDALDLARNMLHLPEEAV